MMDDDIEVVLVEAPEAPAGQVRLVTFKASVELVRRLDELARRMGKSRSEVIREAIVQYLALSEAAVEEPPRYARLPELLAGW